MSGSYHRATVNFFFRIEIFEGVFEKGLKNLSGGWFVGTYYLLSIKNTLILPRFSQEFCRILRVSKHEKLLEF
jgi:hypothetical protein